MIFIPLVVKNGHGYIRSSPWTSSDVLMTLYCGLTPGQRGLIEQDDMPVYAFPQPVEDAPQAHFPAIHIRRVNI